MVLETNLGVWRIRERARIGLKVLFGTDGLSVAEPRQPPSPSTATVRISHRVFLGDANFMAGHRYTAMVQASKPRPPVTGMLCIVE